MKRLTTGMRVHVDAGKGRVTIIREEEEEERQGGEEREEEAERNDEEEDVEDEGMGEETVTNYVNLFTS